MTEQQIVEAKDRFANEQLDTLVNLVRNNGGDKHVLREVLRLAFSLGIAVYCDNANQEVFTAPLPGVEVSNYRVVPAPPRFDSVLKP